MFNDRIYSTKRAASALPSDKNKRVSRSGRRRGAAAPEAGPERRSGALNHDERDLRRPPHPMVQFICAGTTPERRKLKRPRAQRPWGWKGNDGRRLDAVNCDGPDVMVVWNGSRPSRAVGAAPDTPRPPSGRNAVRARPGVQLRDGLRVGQDLVAEAVADRAHVGAHGGAGTPPATSTPRPPRPAARPRRGWLPRSPIGFCARIGCIVAGHRRLYEALQPSGPCRRSQNIA